MLPLNISPLDPLIPIIIMLVKQSGFPQKWNALIALGAYAVWALVSLVFNLRGVEGAVTPEIFLQAFVTAAVTGFVSYQLIFKGLLEDKITAATSIVKEPVTQEVPIEGEDIPDGSSG